MSECKQYLVDQEVIRERYSRVGVLGNGKDSVLEGENMLRVVKDEWLDERGVEQVFLNVNSDFLEKKLEQLHASAFTFFTCDTLPLVCYAIREVADKQDLVVIYEFPSGLVSLEQKMIDNPKMEEEEVKDLLLSISRTLFMGSRFSGEYLDVSPQNIFIGEGNGPSKYKLSNFGVVRAKRFEFKLYNSGDKMYQKGFQREQNNEAYVRSSLFQLGLLSLSLLLGQDTSQYYNLGGLIKQEVLQDVLHTLTLKDQPLLKTVKALLMREESRIPIEDVFSSLGDKLVYYQGSHKETVKQYSGFIQEEEFSCQGDLVTLEGEEYRGGFEKGVYAGQGLLREEETVVRGVFLEGKVSKGMIVEMGESVYKGETVDRVPHGKGVLMSLLINPNSNYLYQEGTFSTGVLTEGHTLYTDLVRQDGYDIYRKCLARKVHGLQYKQVQSQKLQRMNTQQLNQASKEIRKKHMNADRDKQPSYNAAGGQSMLFSQVNNNTNNNTNNNNNNASQMKLQMKKQTFRGEGVLFMHVVSCRGLEKKETNGWQVKLSFNEGVSREFISRVGMDMEQPLFHLRELVKMKMSRDQVDSQRLEISLCKVEGGPVVGRNSLPLEEMYYKGGIWINKFVDLFQPTPTDTMQEQNDIVKQIGQVYVQLQWRPSDMASIDKKEPKTLLDMQVLQQHRKQILPSSTPQLVVNLSSATHLRPSDYMGITDSYIQATLLQGDTPIHSFHTNWIPNTNDPKWDYSIKLSLPQNISSESNWCLQLKLYDYQLDSIELLGSLSLSLNEILSSPGLWINQIDHLLFNDSPLSSTLYSQLLYRLNPNTDLIYPNKLR